MKESRNFFQASIAGGKRDVMKLLYRRCAGLDVHKSWVRVCVRRRVPGSGKIEMEEAAFGTFTQDLRRRRKWLKERKVRQVAMESTGVYWIRYGMFWKDPPSN